MRKATSLARLCGLLSPLMTSPTTSALGRLKEAIRREAAGLGVARTDGSAQGSGAVGSWRAECYRQLLVSKPGFKPEEAAQIAVELSKDREVGALQAEQVAIAACRLLGAERPGIG